LTSTTDFANDNFLPKKDGDTIYWEMSCADRMKASVNPPEMIFHIYLYDSEYADNAFNG